MTEYAEARPSYTLIYVLVLANVVVFIAQLFVFDPAFVERWVLSAEHVFAAERYAVLVVSGFLHQGLVHLGMNMVFLHLLGRACIDTYGTTVTALVYVTAMLTGGIAFITLFPEQTAIGASGAIFGLVGAAMLGAPARSVFHRVPVLRVFSLPLLRNLSSAIVVSTIFLVIPNLLNAFNLAESVAHIAHVGGLAAGAVFALVLRPAQFRKGLIAAAIFAMFVAVLLMDLGQQANTYALYGILGAAVILRALLALA